jgi:ADP-dependent NAD(P)H-hydrate dehydratase
MSDATPLDSTWIAAHPAPVHGRGTDKNTRGRVLVVGGARRVPGAIRLTGEAALRAGAGKLQMATVAPCALPLGLAVPEAGVIALPEDDAGEIADAAAALRPALERCDAVVVGPGIGDTEAARGLVALVADAAAGRDDLRLVLDAVAITCSAPLERAIAALGGRVVLTPHHGEMAGLTGDDADAVAAAPERYARDVARRFGAVVALKGSETAIAAPDGTLLAYGGGGIGLATAGSGDVLAGAVAGLLSRGLPPLEAAGWGVWLHGQGGRRAATRRGPVGFLAREVPEEFPHLLPQ